MEAPPALGDGAAVAVLGVLSELVEVVLPLPELGADMAEPAATPTAAPVATPAAVLGRFGRWRPIMLAAFPPAGAWVVAVEGAEAPGRLGRWSPIMLAPFPAGATVRGALGRAIVDGLEGLTGAGVSLRPEPNQPPLLRPGVLGEVLADGRDGEGRKLGVEVEGFENEEDGRLKDELLEEDERERASASSTGAAMPTPNSIVISAARSGRRFFGMSPPRGQVCSWPIG